MKLAKWNPNGKLAVVTGASSGIGYCLTRRLVAAGCRVIAVARRGDRLRLLADEIADPMDSPNASQCMVPKEFASQPVLLPIIGDVTSNETRDAILSAVQHHGGSLDLLVNNAGIGGIGPFDTAAESRLRRIMEVNFFAPVELTRRLLPALKSSGDGVICNLSSVLAHRAVPNKSEYCASKFALHGWSDSLRAELADHKVAVTLVSPSTTRSEFFDSLVESDMDAKPNRFGSWSADRVAAATLHAIRRRRAEVVLSLGGKLLVYTDRCCPPLMNWILKLKKAKSST